MKKSLYSIVDQKAQVYLPPFLAHNDNDAQRQVLTTMQKEQSLISMYPEDYALCKLGSYDDNLGVITPMLSPELLINCKALFTSFKESRDDRPAAGNQAQGISPALGQ